MKFLVALVMVCLSMFANALPLADDCLYVGFYWYQTTKAADGSLQTTHPYYYDSCLGPNACQNLPFLNDVIIGVSLDELDIQVPGTVCNIYEAYNCRGDHRLVTQTDAAGIANEAISYQSFLCFD
jgi:hypothetical protein